MHLDQLRQSETINSDVNDTSLMRRLEEPRPCRVMVVDDDDLVRARLATLLRAAHFDVKVAASGAEALRIMGETHCQVLITDWEMPDMDGLNLCRNVRTNQGDSYVYVIMHTIRDGHTDRLTGLTAGVDDYMVKGAPIEELLARMEVGRRITHIEISLRQSNRESRRQAVTDELTATNNLRYFVKHLPRELVRAERYGHPLAVLSCDIDHFKEVNDNYGHEAGNDVLKAFVARTESCIRASSDWLARVGGDEFMIVLPETDLAGAKRVVQKLELAFKEKPVDTHVGPVAFTVSIGVTAVDVSHETESTSAIKHLLRTVDSSLYASKRLGRRSGDEGGAAAVSAKGEKMMTQSPIDDKLQGLRASFSLRMGRERVHFARVSAALADAGQDHVPMYKDLCERARRLHGGAFLFEFAEVGLAAGALEKAAMLALASPNGDAEASLKDSLSALVKRMGQTQ
jgi:two-component system, cell cycle response regulator